jgi:UDP-N-acetylglucosamine pyrophosphorylase
VIIMAARKGTRMKNPDLAKVMYALNGRPMIDHVVDQALELEPAKTIAVVGWQKDTVIEHLIQAMKPVVCVEQSPQLGTGHAVMQAEAELNGFLGDVLVLSGDVPLLTGRTLRRLVSHHRESGASATVLTTVLEDPTGYGRIVRTESGAVAGIVEHRDATESQRAIREINSGIYLFDRRALFDGLRHITPENTQKEYYLTDVFQYFWKHDLPIAAVVAGDPTEVQGINTLEQLEEARAIWSLRYG